MDALDSLIKTALAEDIGSGDVTSQLLIPENAQAELRFVTRQPLVACGVGVPEAVYRQLDKQVKVKALARDGEQVKAGAVLAAALGPARALLTGERVVLNIMQRMSGVATLTRQFVDAVKGTKAIIIDTRKTMPGMRVLDKYAVVAGGGQNHRMGLYDMVLIKDNHIALAGGIANAISKVRRESSLPIVVECDTLKQVSEALMFGPDRILLDNMDTATLKEAVKMAEGKVTLEASGNASLENVRAVAETGIDYISIGRLTHSAPAVDIGADIIFS